MRNLSETTLTALFTDLSINPKDSFSNSLLRVRRRSHFLFLRSLCSFCLPHCSRCFVLVSSFHVPLRRPRSHFWQAFKLTKFSESDFEYESGCLPAQIDQTRKTPCSAISQLKPVEEDLG